ncbi:hypothetical protein Tcan_18185 [Toxocara canis]|uniref:Uncharacterized protein n=1 Tax=Toxocara canis TaxID=6265 RepID=A0A0B2V3H0_TOXCA|nr:hypothetical protein Tcan_18185 [Toxocara canis]
MSDWFDEANRSMTVMYVLSGTVLMVGIMCVIILTQYRRKRLNWYVKTRKILAQKSRLVKTLQNFERGFF